MKTTKASRSQNPQFPAPAIHQPLEVPEMKALSTMKTPLHDSMGVIPAYTRQQYMKIVHQDENLAVKLKAISPFAREIGLIVDDDNSNQINNITIVMPQEIVKKHNLTPTEKIIDV